jgi:hypothetical protein
MPTFDIKTKHSVTYAYRIEADTIEEASRQAMENEVEGHLVDEGDKELVKAEPANDSRQ